MAKHTIYLNEKMEAEIRNIEAKEGGNFSNIICRRLEMASNQNQYYQRVKNLEHQVGAICGILALMAGDFGYVVGCTRASTKSYEKISAEGHAYEAYMRQALAILKKNFDEQ